MPLSLNKLRKILYEKGFITKKMYKIKGNCNFIEIISILSGDMFMLYVPSKYKFRVDEECHKMKLIELNNEDREEIANEYAESPNQDRMEDIYDEIELETDYNKKNIDNIEKLLEGKYKKPIHLKDLNVEDSYDVKCIFRQLRRLKYCVQSIRYKLVLKYKKYLCVLHLDDTIECFYIKSIPAVDQRKIMVTMDLELFYENFDNLTEEIAQVKTGISKVLDKNHENHSKTLQKMLDKKETIIQVTNQLFIKKNELRKYIHHFQKLLNDMNASEKTNKKRLDNLNYKNNGTNSNLTISQQKRTITEEIKKNYRLKDEIIDNILNVQNKEEHVSLIIDKILFDNTVMLDRIFKNLNDLSNIL
jgi:hypothetical protein